MIYKVIQEYEELYKIDNLGNIYSLKTGKLRKATLTPYGYMRICLSKNGRCVSHHVHKLVALTFIPNPDNKPCINHKNFDKTDNRVANLEWCSHKENTIHMYQNKPTKKGMTPERANEVRELYKQGGYRQVDLAEMFGISRSEVGGILNNYYWKY